MNFNPETHEYTENGLIIPSVSQVIKSAGLVDLSNIDPDVLENARNWGEAVHKTLELEDLRQLDEDNLDHALRASLEGWRDFLMVYNAKIEMIEKPLLSKHYGYAGTLDRILWLNNKKHLLDIKTSSSIRKETAIQLSAYLWLYKENYSEEFNTSGCSICALQIRPDGEWKLKYFDDCFKVFEACLTLYNWKKK